MDEQKRQEIANEIIEMINRSDRPSGDEWLTAREVADMTGENVEKIRKKLPDLVKKGMIDRERFGLIYYYRLKKL